MKKYVIGIILLVLALFAVILFSSPSENKQAQNKAETVNLQDAHGLAVDRKNSSKVYIATHTGLLVMNNDSELQ